MATATCREIQNLKYHFNFGALAYNLRKSALKSGKFDNLVARMATILSNVPDFKADLRRS